MVSHYVYLGLSAVMTATVVLLVRAVHFSRVGNRVLLAETEELRRDLEVQKQAAAESRDGAERGDALIRLLDRQVLQYCTEIDKLRMLLLQRDQEIRLLQEDAERTVSSGPISGPGVAASGEIALPSAPTLDQARPSPGSERSAPLITAEEQLALLSPAPPYRHANRSSAHGGRPAGANVAQDWKESLDRMLGVLDVMEREVRE